MATWEEMGKAGVGVELMKEFREKMGAFVSPGESFIKIRTQNFLRGIAFTAPSGFSCLKGVN